MWDSGARFGPKFGANVKPRLSEQVAPGRPEPSPRSRSNSKHRLGLMQDLLCVLAANGGLRCAHARRTSLKFASRLAPST